ncbi:right-handed parallel beta-helix repeat-containing protein [bacterium]|nr:right-handed parallel beta-helix repeat-containing protein [bacterium]
MSNEPRNMDMRALAGKSGVIGLLLSLLVSGLARADTTFVAAGTVDALWTSSGSPYVVQGNISVLAGDSLTIEPGVRVYFAGAYSLSVFGYLAVNGAHGDSVVFTTDTLQNPTKWRGMSLSNADDSSYIQYAVFEHSLANGNLGADSLGGALIVSNGTTISVEHTTFRRNRAELAGGGVYVSASTLLMDSCFFERNISRAEGGGLFLNNSVNSVVSSTRLFRNSALNGSGGGSYVRGTTPLLMSCTFDSNFARVNGGGIMFKNSFATLDCTVIKGNQGRGHGGGIACENSSPQIIDCVLDANYTTDFDGGGIYNWESSPHMLRCKIVNNRSADDGGGIHSYRELSNGIFEQCEVRGNLANGEGAGIWVTLDGAPTFIDCIVRDNTAGLYGGGVFLRNNAHPTFTNCDFDSNTSLGNGGGLSIRQSQPTLSNCRIRSNSADDEGGGVHLWEAAEAVVTNCLIADNSAGLNGGGISTNQSTLTATNCLVVSNSTAAQGGGLATANASKINLLHCTFGGNIGGGLRLESSVSDIENTVIGASAGNNLYLAGGSSSRVAYSLIETSPIFSGNDPSQGPPHLGILTATNANGDSCDTYFNVYGDAEFTDESGGDWSLMSSSRAIGAGNWNLLATDLAGEPRPQPVMTLPDMGAFESVDGFSPDGLFGSLFGALGPDTFKVVADIVIDSANSLVLAPGTTLLFCGPSGMQVSGILNAIGTVTDSISFVTDTSTNPGRWRGMVMNSNAGASELEHVLIADARAIDTKRTQGGAIRMNGVSPTLTSCTLTRHRALQGGIVYLEQSSPQFIECVFAQGVADSGGLVCSRSGSNPVIDYCVLTGGSATAGGGFLAQGATGQVRNSILCGNSSTSTGGAVFLDAAPALIRNNLVLNNSSTTGGAFWTGSTSAQIEFNTIAGNSAVDGAGIYMRFGSTQVKNNIIADNNGDGIYFFVTPTSVIRNNCVAINDSANFAFFGNSPSQGPAGLGGLDSLNANGDPCDRYYNIQLNPRWVSGSGHEYYLAHITTGDSADSPCVNAGETSATAPEGSTRTDFVADGGIADQGYHGPETAGPPAAIDDLVIRATVDSIYLYWSYEGTGLFTVKSDSLLDGNFETILAVTTDTSVVLPNSAPLHPLKGYFHVTVEPLE